MTIMQTSEKIEGQEITIFVDMEKETSPTPRTGRRSSGAAASVHNKVGDLFTRSMETVKSVARLTVHHMEELGEEVTPDGVELKFGLKMDANVGGGIIAKLGAGAQLEVTLKWQKQPVNIEKTLPGAEGVAEKIPEVTGGSPNE